MFAKKISLSSFLNLLKTPILEPSFIYVDTEQNGNKILLKESTQIIQAAFKSL